MIEKSLLSKLTNRELEALSHIAEGMSDKEISEIMHITANTVRAHLCSIYAKLNLTGYNIRTTATTRLNAALIYLKETGRLK